MAATPPVPSARPRRPVRRWAPSLTVVILAAGLSLATATDAQAAPAAPVLSAPVLSAPVLAAPVAPVSPPAAGVASRPSATGFTWPFSGFSRWERFAPTRATSPEQVNQPLGAARAAVVAAGLGLDREDSLTPEQFRAFVTGRGEGGDPAQARIIDESIAILTNTTGRPLPATVDGQPTLTVLGSYGLYVDTDGTLMSPANLDAPTRQINELLRPAGYINRWLVRNGAHRTLAMLYRSAYLPEAYAGYLAQQASGAAQLVTNTKGGVSTTVGMSMAPPLWLVNFALIWAVSPDLAAAMPAYWTPVPPAVVGAMTDPANTKGQLPWADYRDDFPDFPDFPYFPASP